MAGAKEIDLVDFSDGSAQTGQSSLQDELRLVLERLRRGDYSDDLAQVKLADLNLSRADLQEAESSLMAAFAEATARSASPRVLIEDNWSLVPGSWEFGKLFVSLQEHVEWREANEAATSALRSDPRSALGFGWPSTVSAH